MEKKCTRCGHMMHLYLRKLVYMNHTHIEHVPVYRCCNCEHHELVDQIKEDLRLCLQRIQPTKDVRAISFAEHSVFTRMMLRDRTHSLILSIDEWLDLYLLVQSLGDYQWLDEIKGKIARYVRKKCE
jgi:hypothetical protein